MRICVSCVWQHCVCTESSVLKVATDLQAVDALERRLHALQQMPPQEKQGRALRVITGRGLHSSDGEASLPRAVGTRLEDLKQSMGLRIVQRVGAFEVFVGRQTAGQRRPW